MRACNPIHALPVAVLLLLAAAPSAAAVPAVTLEVSPAETRYRDLTTISGTVTDGGAPLAGQEVVLQARAYPYQGEFVELARTTTDAAGAFRFQRLLDRNHAVQAVAAGQASERVRAYVFP